MGILERLTGGIVRRIAKEIGGVVMLQDAKLEEYDVTMRDGVLLKTRMYFPGDVGVYPILFARSPYYNEFAIYDALFREVSRLGFTVCYQACRGTGGSAGIFEPFINERNDWFDTVAWLKEATDTSRGIGLYGASYLAFNHLVTADNWPPEVCTAFLAVFGDSIYDVFYTNGALKESFTLNWFMQNNGIKNINPLKAGALFTRSKKVIDKASVLDNILDIRFPGYDKIMSGYLREGGNPDWDLVNHGLRYVNVPVCIVGGWFDFASSGQLRLFENMQPEVKMCSRLIMGPWNHTIGAFGDYRTPRANEGGIQGIKYALEWFIRHFYQSNIRGRSSVLSINENNETAEKPHDVKHGMSDDSISTTINVPDHGAAHNTRGRSNVLSIEDNIEIAEEPYACKLEIPSRDVSDNGVTQSDLTDERIVKTELRKIVRYYSIGEGFVESDGIPATESERLYLDDGVLSTEPGESLDSYIFNPSRPSMTAGGGATFPDMIPLAGRPKQWTAKQTTLLRKDTLVYLSDVFSENVRIFGAFKICLDFETDCPDTMIYAKICLLEDGNEYHMCDGITTLYSALKGLTDAGRQTVRFETGPAAFLVKPGACLTLRITSSDYPAYSVHSNESYDYLHSKSRRKALNTVHYGENSYIELQFINNINELSSHSELDDD